MSSFVQIWGYESEEYETVGVFVYMKGDDFEISAELGYIDEVILSLWQFWSNLSASLLLANVAAIELICFLKLIKVLAGPALIFPFRMSPLYPYFLHHPRFRKHRQHRQPGSLPTPPRIFNLSRLFYLLPLLLSIALYTNVDIYMVFLVWQNHNLYIPNRLELPLLVCLFLLLMGYVVSMFYWGNFWWHIVGSQLALVGQVVRNVRKNCQEGFNLYYIFGYVGVRFVVPIY